MKFRIIRDYDDYESLVLGIVELKVRSKHGGLLKLRREWKEFQDTRPNSDDDFID